jgi:steroid 5-alpha reductase family enzyme
MYETIADSELRQFVRTKEEGQILTQGLRKFHRYPQYFGESLFWFGISFIAAQISLLAFAGWGLITFLLLFVSGVPLLEARYKGQRNYSVYKKKTPIFFPDYRKIWER